MGVVVNGVKADHGAANHTDITRTLFIPALAGLVEGAGGSRASRSSWGVAQCDNNASSVIYISLEVPEDFVSFTTLKCVWMSSAAAGNMYWRMTTSYATSGENYIIHQDLAAAGATANGGANVINIQEGNDPTVMGSLASGDYIGIYWERQGGNGSDTLEATAYCIGFLLTYTANQ